MNLTEKNGTLWSYYECLAQSGAVKASLPHITPNLEVIHALTDAAVSTILDVHFGSAVWRRNMDFTTGE